MKRYLASLLAILLIVLPLCGCEQNTIQEPVKDPVKEDLLDYMSNHMPPLASLEKQATEAYNVRCKTASNADEAVKVLTEEAMPRYNELIQATEKVQPKTQEVREVHEIYIGALYKIRHALMLEFGVLTGSGDVAHLVEAKRNG